MDLRRNKASKLPFPCAAIDRPLRSPLVTLAASGASSASGASTTSGAVAYDVSFQETAKLIYTAEMRRKAAVGSAPQEGRLWSCLTTLGAPYLATSFRTARSTAGSNVSANGVARWWR